MNTNTLSDVDNVAAHQLFETNIAVDMRHQLSPAVMLRMQEMHYVLKRRLVIITWRVYQSTLLLDGNRLSVVVNDLSMLGDVLSQEDYCVSAYS